MRPSRPDSPDRLWDENLLLLSTDWFRAFWSLFGLSFDFKTAGKIQASAQEAVKEMMKDATVFWFADISETRIQSTQENFFRRLINDRIDRNDVELLRRMMNALTVEIKTQTDRTISSFESLLRRVIHPDINHPISTLPPKLDQLVRKEGATDFDPESIDSDIFDEHVDSSNTPWDRYVKSLTEDMPDWTATVAYMRYRYIESFRSKWLRIDSQLTPEERKFLINWFIEETKKYSHPDFLPKLPDWMN